MNTKDYQEAIDRIGNRLVEKIKYEIQKKDLVDTGSLRDSIEYNVSGNDILVLANYYLPYAEYGRTEGKIPYRFGDMLADWAKRKGIVITKGTYKDFGWAVAMKTKFYGSSRYRKETPPADVLDIPVQQIMDETVLEEFQALIEERLDQIYK